MRPLKYVIADAFSETPLEGNPVAVFTNAVGLSAAYMQRIARELNLSETTFVFPPEGGGDYLIRIFTPVNELPFAGHPMLGTAVVLGDQFYGSNFTLETEMGPIRFMLERDASGHVRRATMEQPIPTFEPYEHERVLLEAIGVESSVLPVDIYRNGPRHVFVGIQSANELSRLSPNIQKLATLSDVAVNCFAPAGGSWRMRMFSPAYGVTEDAATGSAAGPLGLHLIRHGLARFDTPLEIIQGVEINRISTMHVQVAGSLSKIGPIRVSGAAIIVGHGELTRY